MDCNQAKNANFDDSNNEQLARFLDCLGEAELALQEYLVSRANSPDKTSNNVPGEDYLSALRERAEKARYDDSMELDGLSQSEIKHLFHELQVHQVELHMQNEELRRVQLELEASRDRFSRLYDYAPIGYCTIDRKGIILEANYTLCSLLGVRLTELIRKPIQHYIDPEDQDRFYLYQRAAIQNRSNQICELQMIGPSRARFTAQFESRSVPDQPDQFWLVVSDISNLKRWEEIAARYEDVLAAVDALEVERSRYRDLFEFAPDSYFVTDEAGMILEVNLAGAALVNLTKEQLVGTSIIQYILRENQSVFFDFLNSILKMPSVQSGVHTDEWEFQIQPNERDLKSVIASAALLRDKRDNSIRIRWLFRDVTLRKQAEVALGKSESRFHALFEESSIGIRLLDEQGTPLVSNRALQDILGYNEDEL